MPDSMIPPPVSPSGSPQPTGGAGKTEGSRTGGVFETADDLIFKMLDEILKEYEYQPDVSLEKLTEKKLTRSLIQQKN